MDFVSLVSFLRCNNFYKLQEKTKIIIFGINGIKSNDFQQPCSLSPEPPGNL